MRLNNCCSRLDSYPRNIHKSRCTYKWLIRVLEFHCVLLRELNTTSLESRWGRQQGSRFWITIISIASWLSGQRWGAQGYSCSWWKLGSCQWRIKEDPKVSRTCILWRGRRFTLMTRQLECSEATDIWINGAHCQINSKQGSVAEGFLINECPMKDVVCMYVLLCTYGCLIQCATLLAITSDCTWMVHMK